MDILKINMMTKAKLESVYVDHYVARWGEGEILKINMMTKAKLESVYVDHYVARWGEGERAALAKIAAKKSRATLLYDVEAIAVELGKLSEAEARAAGDARYADRVRRTRARKPPPPKKGRPFGAKDSAPRVPVHLVACPVRVTPAATDIVRQRGSAWLSALIEGAGPEAGEE